MKRRYTILLTLLVSSLLASSAVLAQAWSELSDQQQQQLSDFRVIWQDLDEDDRRQLIRSAEQINRMSPANRRKLVQSMGDS